MTDVTQISVWRLKPKNDYEWCERNGPLGDPIMTLTADRLPRRPDEYIGDVWIPIYRGRQGNLVSRFYHYGFQIIEFAPAHAELLLANRQLPGSARVLCIYRNRRWFPDPELPYEEPPDEEDDGIVGWKTDWWGNRTPIMRSSPLPDKEAQ